MRSSARLRSVMSSMRGHPAAVCQRLVDDLDRAAARGLDDLAVSLSRAHVAHDRGAKFVDVAVERSGLLAMGDQVLRWCSPA